MTDLTYAKIIADSIGQDAPRLVTFELQYPRIVHAELMTHRVFSRNASSSRAIPVKRMLDMLMANPAQPAEWRMNEPGMQGYTVAPPEIAAEAVRLTLMGRDFMADVSRKMETLGLHKQHVNRETERWQYIKVVLTTSQLKNWFGLRDHHAADPTIQKLARLMREALDGSTATKVGLGGWHLPYVTDEDYDRAFEFMQAMAEPVLDQFDILKRMSAARCARVSYNNFKGEVPKVSSDLALYDKLITVQPVHASPTEHQASPDIYLGIRTGWSRPEKHGNLTGWLQFRKFIANENLELTA